MKLKLSLLFFFFSMIFVYKSYGQLVVSDSGGCILPEDIWSPSGTIAGRNSYTATLSSLGGTPCRVQWSISRNRWEIVLDFNLDGFFDDSDDLLQYNTANTTPNPPPLGIGQWIYMSSDCEGLTQFSGLYTCPSISGTAVVTNVTCFGGNNGAIDLTPTGGTGPYTFVWSGGGSTSEDRTGLSAGNYSVNITDANGCTGIVNVSVTQPTALLASITIEANPSCGNSNGSATVSVSGGTPGYTYLWSPSGGTAATAAGLSAGIYTVTITDNNDCTTTQTFTLPNTGSPNAIAASQTNVSCNGGSNGLATVAVVGGTGPYTYSWFPSGGTGQTASGLTAGTYTVTVTDANGCQDFQSFTITQPSVPLSGSTGVTNVSCFGGSNGSINLTPTGGTAPYTYNWGGGVTTQDRIALPAGTYSVVITDFNNCSTTISNIAVTQPLSSLSGSTAVTNVACNGGNTGAINLTPTGGTGPYTFVWSDG
ncbi:SprB repeat-containing protein, partial [Pedobacter glucosidilyticus]|uniref:SprB repeat-containing protein n=1 Tax=Pedobacter glucosidilyticus TaxID=1122941 RepID=UPI001B7FBE29